MNPPYPQKKRLRFTYNDDLTFLKEVIAENPFRDPSAWEVVQKHLELLIKKTFTIKTLKNHLELLLEAFIKKDKVDPLRSGVEEPYCELDDLLREVSLISVQYKEAQIRKKTKISKDKQLSQLGKTVREKYASEYASTMTKSTSIVEDNNQEDLGFENIYVEPHVEHDYCESNLDNIVACEITVIEHNEQQEPSTSSTTAKLQPKNNESKTQTTPLENKRKILTPNRKRQNRAAVQRNSSLNYLSEKQEKDREIKMKEFELEERKIVLEDRKLTLSERHLNLEEARFELEKTEKLERVKIEVEEKKITSQLLKCQQEFIENLVKNRNQNM